MESLSIPAKLQYIIFYNQENHYIVAQFSETKTYHLFTATGTMIDPLEDQEYELNGQYVNHPRYGKQFKIQSAQRLLPKHSQAIIQFLSGSSFPTIGKKTATQIYEALGDDCLSLIQENPSVLHTVKSLSDKKIGIIINGIEEFQGFDQTYAKLISLGLDTGKIALLQKNYENTMEVIEENCFRPFYEIYGFGYRSACKLADQLNMPTDDSRRLDAYIYETLRNLTMRSGNTYIQYVTLFSFLSQIEPAVIRASLERLELLDSVHLEQQRIYVFNLYKEEESIANSLYLHRFPIEKVDEELIDHQIELVEFETLIQYDAMQKQAIQTFFNQSLMIINGGPGTGKTTIVHGILTIIRNLIHDAKVQLCAPTGRASKRLADLSDYNSKTIHSLLKWNMEDNSFAMNEDEPLDCDFLIVDEFSMVDTHLFCMLLRALPARCRILLIGDEDQLESVGPGKVFKDIIDSQICPVIHLEKIFRQKNGSGIVTLASQIRKEEDCTYEDGVDFLSEATQDILPVILQIAQKIPADQLQILAPMYHGPAAIDEINHAMQMLCNPPAEKKHEIRVGTTTFRENDKVMLLKNMPDDDVYNGDIGTIEYIEVEKQEYCVGVNFGSILVEFTSDLLYYLKHAYCISIHKAQGSEYPTVICVVDPTMQSMLNKRLLYTAISRAKKHLILVGNKQLFENAVRLKQKHIRQTTLADQIQKRLQQNQS